MNPSGFPSPEIMSAEELIKYCDTYKETIYVREFINNHWINSPISEVSGSVLLKHLVQWLRDRKLPHRVRTKEV